MPRNLVDTVIALRQLMAAHYDASLLLEQEFEDERSEALATGVRLQCAEAAAGVYELLEQIESTKAYRQLRRRHIDTMVNK